MCLGWRRDLHGELPRERVSPVIVYRLHQGAQLFFNTKAIATVVPTLLNGKWKVYNRRVKAKAERKAFEADPTRLVREVISIAERHHTTTRYFQSSNWRCSHIGSKLDYDYQKRQRKSCGLCSALQREVGEGSQHLVRHRFLKGVLLLIA